MRALRLAVGALLVVGGASSFLGAPRLGRAPLRAFDASPAVAMKAKKARLNPPKTVRIGLVGGGTVGGGIVEILGRKANFAEEHLDLEIQIARICVADTSKPRDFELPEGCELSTNTNDIIDDPSIDIVVEVMGGVDLAKEVTWSALKAGKHVVTANKALLAANLPELQKMLDDVNRGRSFKDIPMGSSLQARPLVQLGYEAAVCGGIPIIHTLQRDFCGDDVLQMTGIINGCTNYMLSAMSSRDGGDYARALAEAQKLGFAEASSWRACPSPRSSRPRCASGSPRRARCSPTHSSRR